MNLHKRLETIARDGGAEALSVAVYDYETRLAWSFDADRFVHAASTIKLAILLAVFDAAAQGRFKLSDRLHVRNRFLSAHDGEPFRVAADRDGNDSVHQARGKLIRIRTLATQMIVTSSNLATNLLLDLVGVEAANETLTRLGIQGVRLVRGVEDERAYDAGLNNEVTAHGLSQMLRLIEEERGFEPEAAHEMREILLQQRFRSGIPAGLPEQARVAHKTGEISTVAHDAGLVFLPDRKPYVLALLTEWDRDVTGRRPVLAACSKAIYEYLTQPAPADDDAA